MRIMTSARCPECGRVFGLLYPRDAQDWHYGHDCDESLVDATGSLIEEPRKTSVDIRGAITDNSGQQGRSGPAAD